jgi:hypothetical protein
MLAFFGTFLAASLWAMALCGVLVCAFYEGR